ncbi:unnamed protein product [Schistocephalus solidus]|uniref:Uncharacterized protein n=1 Tax=Schistocephalus solidus TaxID=70667 RepID=A0A183TN09_SCHSO|nr:unnamed protein product [Schistocephalus solidus]
MEENARPSTQSSSPSSNNKPLSKFGEFICAGCICVPRRHRQSPPYVISVGGEEPAVEKPETRLNETATIPNEPSVTHGDAQVILVEPVLNPPESPDKALTPISDNRVDAIITGPPPPPLIAKEAWQLPAILRGETVSESRVNFQSGAAPMFMWKFGDEEDSFEHQPSEAD